MYYLNEYDEEKKKENLEILSNYHKEYKKVPKTELLELFNDLLNSFDKEKIFFPYLQYNSNYVYHSLSFSTTTRDSTYDEKLNKVKDFDFNISFSHGLEQYDIKYSKNDNENKEYINILVSTCSKIFINNYEYNGNENDIRKNFSSNTQKSFELIIYSKDAIFVKKNEKIFPFKLSNIAYYPNNIFKILFEIFAKTNPLYRDILREHFAEDNPFNMLNIGILELNSSYNKKQLLEKVFNLKLFNRINSFSLYEGYIICCALKLIEENYYCEIFKYAKSLKEQGSFHNNFFTYSSSKKEIGFRLLNKYYMEKISHNEFRGNIYVEIDDFLEYEYKTKKCISLNIASLNKIKKYAFYSNIINDAKKKKTFRITKKNHFNELELPEGFKRIKTKKELIELSKRMRVNFFSSAYHYAKIRTDQYALYTIKINSDIFAVMIKVVIKDNPINNKHHKYSLLRVQTTKDKRIPWELYDDINNLIKYNNKYKLGGFINEL